VDKVSGRYQEKYQDSEQEIRQPEKDGTLGTLFHIDLQSRYIHFSAPYLRLRKIQLFGILLDILYGIAIPIHYVVCGYTHSSLYSKAAAELRGINP
jgi:hypothetical protein